MVNHIFPGEVRQDTADLCVAKFGSTTVYLEPQHMTGARNSCITHTPSAIKSACGRSLPHQHQLFLTMLVTPQCALDDARRSAFYLGHDSIADHITWVTTFDDRVELAVARPPDGSVPDSSVLPVVFSGIFQIMPSMFYLDVNMGIDANRPAQWQVRLIKVEPLYMLLIILSLA
jgi:hypothetical protein